MSSISQTGRLATHLAALYAWVRNSLNSFSCRRLYPGILVHQNHALKQTHRPRCPVLVLYLLDSGKAAQVGCHCVSRAHGTLQAIISCQLFLLSFGDSSRTSTSARPATAAMVPSFTAVSGFCNCSLTNRIACNLWYKYGIRNCSLSPVDHAHCSAVINRAPWRKPGCDRARWTLQLRC
jgi:hypothetical protein